MGILNRRITYNAGLFCSLILVLATTGCRKDDNEISFYERVAGTWVPYQIQYEDRIEQTDLLRNNIFGAYDESVQMHGDRKFIPGTITPDNNFAPDPQEQGTYSYDGSTKKLVFTGSHVIEFEVLHLNRNELQLSSFGLDQVIYYYRRRQ